MNRTSLVALVLVAPSVLAGGKSFSDGLSVAEVTRLTRAYGLLEGKYNEARPAIEQLKADPELNKTGKLSDSGAQVVQSYATIGTFLDQMKEALETRDPKLNSLEVGLKGELAAFDRRLDVLYEQAKSAEAPTVAEQAANASVIATALHTLYVRFDAIYDAAVADVDLTRLPAYDVAKLTEGEPRK
jgi:hypothetical protein